MFKLQTSKKPEERQLARILGEQEYANLGTALRFALDQQASIRHLNRVLSGHLDLLREHCRGRELGELVLEKIEQLPPAALQADTALISSAS